MIRTKVSYFLRNAVLARPPMQPCNAVLARKPALVPCSVLIRKPALLPCSPFCNAIDISQSWLTSGSTLQDWESGARRRTANALQPEHSGSSHTGGGHRSALGREHSLEGRSRHDGAP